MPVKHKFLRFLSLILVLSSIASILASCQSPAGKKTSGDKRRYTFGCSYMTLNNPHFIEWSKGLKSVFEPNGDILVEADSQLNLSKQISDIEDLVQQRCDLIFISCVDSKGIKPALLAAKNAGIPIIVIDIPIEPEDDNLIVSTVCTNNIMAGRLAGEACAKVMNGKANIAIIDWSVIRSVVDRDNGFLDAIKPYPGMKVVVRQNASASTESALPVMENFLQSNPEINVVFCINDPTALGALAACEASKRTDIKIFSVDGSKDGIKLTKQGKIVGTAAQFPREMGVITAKRAYEVLSGKTVEKRTLIDSVWIDSTNADTYLKNW